MGAFSCKTTLGSSQTFSDSTFGKKEYVDSSASGGEEQLIMVDEQIQLPSREALFFENIKPVFTCYK